MLHRIFAASLLAVLFALPAHSSLVIGGTRVIYEAKDAETTVKLSNEGKLPALAQTWVDNGNPQAEPTTSQVPFLVTPPISRIDPGKSQTLRIVHTGEPLPANAESVFWLNVVEVPPKPSDTEINQLQIAFRTRIKLFFRPDQLKGSASDAPDQLQWHWTDGKIAVGNSSPYHVSLILAEVDADGVTAKSDGEMIAPGQKKILALDKPLEFKPGMKVRFRWLNDYGGAVNGEAALQGP